MQSENSQTLRENIVEYLIANQQSFKDEVETLRKLKNEWLTQLHSVFRTDLEEQYEARIRQHIAFTTSNALGIPAEYVIIELEKIELDEFLSI